MTSERISISSSMPGRPLKKTSTISSKLNSQNGSLTLRGVSTSALSPKKRPYSLWASTRKMRRSGRDFRSSCRMIATPEDLPTPVVPSTAKCLPTISVPLMIAADAGVLLQMADIDRARAGHLVDDAQLGVGHHGDAVADRGIVGDAALEAGAARGVAHDLAHQVELRGRDKSLVPAADGTSTETSVIMPIRSDVPLWMDRNLPTVARASSDAPACGGREPDGGLRSVDGEHAADRLRTLGTLPVLAPPVRRWSMRASRPPGCAAARSWSRLTSTTPSL